MVEPVNVTTTKSPGWETVCLTWAQSAQPFKIRGVQANHLPFCKKLCDQYNYKLNYDSGDREFAGIFVPLS